MSDDLSDVVTVNPLLRPLDPVELDLLETIWDPISRETSPWPVWDYVSRTLYKAPEAHDAEAVAAALPTLPASPGSGPYAAPYGLVWRTRLSGEEHVGLTIAGLLRLAERRHPLKVLADNLTAVISSLAAAERNWVPDPVRTVRPQIPLVPLVQPMAVRTRDFSTPVPARGAIDLLRQEHAPLGIMNGPEESAARPTMYLRSYTGLTGAEDYLNLIALMSQRRQRPAPVRRGEELVQTLDYVSHVLAAHPAWKPTGRLVVVHDLETAATLAANVQNQVEFDHRMSALATVLDDMHTPEPSQEAMERWRKRGGGVKDRPRSLARLEIWLQATLQDDEQRLHRALEAVKDLKSAKDLRNLRQHTGTDLWRKARRACSRLGIGEPIRDWGQAWETVRARVGDAFDDIRRETVSGL